MSSRTLLLTALVAFAAAVPTTLSSRADNSTTPFCSGKASGIYQPAAGAILSQYITDLSCNNFSILYCSGQYDKTASQSTSVWLSSASSGADITSGELLVQNVAPDNQDADAGFYSYRYNVSICPSDGEYVTGSYTLSVYETETGYYNANNYDIASVDVTLATSGASPLK